MIETDVTKIENDLGTFEGFNHRSQSAISQMLPAQDVVDWDHDTSGEAEFWSAGDDALVQAFTRDRREVSAELIIQIDTLMSSLEPDGLVVAVALIEQGYAMSEISAELIEDQTIQSFEAGCFVDARSQAAHALFEDYWPDCQAMWESGNHPDGLIFDAERFLDSPQCSVTEVQLDERRIVLVEVL